MATIPSVQIQDGQVFGSVPTFLTQPSSASPQALPWQNESLPVLDPLPTNEDKFLTAVERRLRHYAILHPADDTKMFWPQKLLDHLLDAETLRKIVKILVRHEYLTVYRDKSVEDAERDWASRIWGSVQEKGFRRVLALLIMANKQDCIQSFLDGGFNDDSLPVAKNHPIFHEWGGVQIDGFHSYQWGFRVPFFASSKDRGKACRIILEKNDIEPWLRTGSNNQKPQSSQTTSSGSSITNQFETMTLGGNYGEVSQIFIHPWQHDFRSSLKSSDPSLQETHFALKRLFSAKRSAFEQEAEMLERFSGHPNIITLLATIVRKKGLGQEEYHLLFPWADGDLLAYWRRHIAKSRKTHQDVRWISAQVRGIAEAVHFIHNPSPMMYKDGEPIYGRHGDIKPENVLWFVRGGEEILVISDLGLSAVHRETSRSNIPGFQIPATPNYRPPECDMAGRNGHISRSFDIWTLGCLFLEYVVWYLDGWHGRERFRDQRFSPYITGAETDVFFDVVAVVTETNKYAFKIKDQVNQQLNDIHEHPDCTQYLHDLTDIIQTDMLILESDEPRVKRIKAADLLAKLKELEERCNDRAYCLKRCPKESEQTPHLPVEAALNEVALQAIGKSNMDERMERFGGETRSANPRVQSP